MASPLIFRSLFGTGRTVSCVLRSGPRPVLDVTRSFRASAVSPVIAKQALARFDYKEAPEQQTYGRHWTIERYLTVGMLGFIPAAFAFPNPVLETAVCAACVIHGHWGMVGIAKDYLHYRGPVLLNLAKGLVYTLTILGLAGLCHFNYSDVGAIQAIKLLWKV